MSSDKPFDEFREALKLGIKTRPVLLGPVTYLSLGKPKEGLSSPWGLLDGLLEVYVEVLKRLKKAGADAVQIDEPILVTDLGVEQKKAFKQAYMFLSKKAPGVGLHLTTYFGSLDANLPLVCALPVRGLHVDLCRAGQQLDALLKRLPKDRELSLGVVDGRNIWKNDLSNSLKILARAAKGRTAPLLVAGSCSLLHVPLDLGLEKSLDAEVSRWMAFAKQKLEEVSALKSAASGKKTDQALFRSNARDLEGRRKSRLTHDPAVRRRLAGIKPGDSRRAHPFKVRQPIQQKKLALPPFPTTTIGSFPQTADVRKARAEFKRGALSQAQYEEFLREKTAECMKRQEQLGLDVLVHGEFERNDMVEYFGEKLEGFLFTSNGWVQSYGSRCVKPPVIFGDVSRREPMTVAWTRYAQSLTSKPVKGMLTGPVTILQWSFVRDDQPRATTARQIALAIRDEVQDLEKAGIGVIQIDEPAIREGLPLRRKEWRAYLDWAVGAFRLASSGVRDETQIHTHMCYSEFNDILPSVAAMDADVISIEASRSQMELLDAFAKFRYPNEIGPGVYDIHSPRVPSPDEITALLKKASKVVSDRNLWVNPDCGLKTRGWEECLKSLEAMITAAHALRK